MDDLFIWREIVFFFRFVFCLMIEEERQRALLTCRRLLSQASYLCLALC